MNTQATQLVHGGARRSAGHSRCVTLDQLMRFRFMAALLVLFSSTALAAPFVYVGNSSTNEFSVTDMANFKTRVLFPLGGTTRIVANEASEKVFINTSTGITILDANNDKILGKIAIPTPVTDLVADAAGNRLYAISGAVVRVIDVVKLKIIAILTLPAATLALVADEDGVNAYALTPGKVNVIRARNGAPWTTIPVNQSATTLAIDQHGEKLYVASSGPTSANGNLGTAAITVINTGNFKVEKIIPTAGLAADVHPTALQLSPKGDKVYVFGGGSTTTSVKYLVLDKVSGVARAVVVPITKSPQFNLTVYSGPTLLSPDGKKLYVGGGSSPNSNQIAEIDTATATNTRVLNMPTNGAEYHYLTGLSSSYTNRRLVLIGFIFEHRIHTASEPHSVGFVDVDSGTTLANVLFAQGMPHSTLYGDVLDPVDQREHSTTTVVEGAGSVPLNDTLTLVARVRGVAPTGRVVFRFVDDTDLTNDQIVRVRVRLNGDSATLTLPGCNQPWDDAALKKIACTSRFLVSARYRGDDDNLRSTSQDVVEFRY